MQDNERRLEELAIKEKQGNMVGSLLTVAIGGIGTLLASFVVNALYGKYAEEKNQIMLDMAVQRYIDGALAEAESEEEES